MRELAVAGEHCSLAYATIVLLGAKEPVQKNDGCTLGIRRRLRRLVEVIS
jgi:hypothetical protein